MWNTGVVGAGTSSVEGRGESVARIAYQPQLDGLRGLAVAAVVIFHSKAAWLPGGYVGVSVFFTLSGYLITALLLAEHHSSGQIRFRAFYARRARRLLPASFVTIAAVAVASHNGWFVGETHLRADLYAALLQVSNWTQLFRGGSYGDQLAARAGVSSPLLHFWSLSVEEQYYWIWPVAVVGCLAVTTRRRWKMSSLLVALTMVFACVSVGIALEWGPNAAYWATPARAAEILAGATVAALQADGRLPTLRSIVPALAGIALVTFCVTFPSDHGPAYYGALPVVGFTTAVLITGIQSPRRFSALLGLSPLRFLGRISYGVYLFHWPIFVVFAERSRLRGPILIATEMLATLMLAVVSYYGFENPIRHAKTHVLALVATGMCTNIVLITALSTTPTAYWASHQIDLDPAAAQDDRPLTAPSPATSDSPSSPLTMVPTSPEGMLPAVTNAPAQTTPSVASSIETATSQRAPIASTIASTIANASTTVPEPDATAQVGNRPVRILLVGDSTAEATAPGLQAWTKTHPRLANSASAVSPGCGLLRGAIPANDIDKRLDVGCAATLDRRLPALLKSFHPDVVVVLVTLADHEPKNFGSGPITALDPTYQQHLDRAYRAFVQQVESSTDAKIVFAQMPDVNPYWLSNFPQGTDYPARAVLEAEQSGLEAEQPTRIFTLNLRDWMSSNQLDTRQDLRPDGIHWTSGGALEVVSRWLGPSIVNLALSNS